MPASLTVDQLLKAVDQLSPTDLHRFRTGLEARTISEESALVRAAQASLPAAAERRLKRLIAKSERGTLTAKELSEYRKLASQAEQLDSRRASALAELVQRRGVSLAELRAQLNGERDDT